LDSGGSVPVALANLAGAGTQTAALAFGGYDTAATGATNEYNGTSWSPGGSMTTARQLLAGAGTQTAALAFGGYDGTYLNATEEYDGATWTARSQQV
jgi:hypothetical protein